MAGHRGKIAFSVVPSRHVPLLIGRDFLTPAGAVVDMGEKTLRIGTGVEKLGFRHEMPSWIFLRVFVRDGSRGRTLACYR